MALSAAKRLLLLDNAATRPGQLTLANVINDADRAAGTQGDGLSNDGSTGIWPAATNLNVNGGASTNTTGWVAQQAGGSGATLARDTSTKLFGAASFLCTPNNTVDQGMVPTSGAFLSVVSPSTTYTVSAFIKAAAGRVHRFTISEYSAGPVFITNQTSAQIVGDGTWRRLIFTLTTGVGTTLIGPTIGANEATTVAFNVDGIQVELGSVATPYIETDGGTASRSAGRVQMPWDAGMFTSTQGWVATRVRMGMAYNTDPGGGTGTPRLIEWALDANNYIEVFFYEGDDKFYLRRKATTNDDVTSAAQTFARGDFVTVIAAWGPSTVRISVNGAAFVSAASTHIPAGLPATIDFGQTGSSTNYLYADQMWDVFGKGIPTNADAAAINALGNTKPTIRALDQVARGARATAVWDGRGGTFERRIGA